MLVYGFNRGNYDLNIDKKHRVTKKEINNNRKIQNSWYGRLFSTKFELSQLAFTCSKLTLETLEQGVKYVQS